jgi:hypothetical protein
VAWLTADDNAKGASMSEARFQPVADLLDPWREDALSGKPPTLYPIGAGEGFAGSSASRGQIRMAVPERLSL